MSNNTNTPAAPQDERATHQLVPTEIVDRFPEINMSNYNGDDVEALNEWGIELVRAALPAQAVARTYRCDVCHDTGIMAHSHLCAACDGAKWRDEEAAQAVATVGDEPVAWEYFSDVKQRWYPIEADRVDVLRRCGHEVRQLRPLAAPVQDVAPTDAMVPAYVLQGENYQHRRWIKIAQALQLKLETMLTAQFRQRGAERPETDAWNEVHAVIFEAEERHRMSQPAAQPAAQPADDRSAYKVLDAYRAKPIGQDVAPTDAREAVHAALFALYDKELYHEPWERTEARCFIEEAAEQKGFIPLAGPDEHPAGPYLCSAGALIDMVEAARAQGQADVWGMNAAQPAAQRADAQAREHLLQWAVDRWTAEVEQRPLQNVHHRSLDDTWRQVIQHCGGDPDALVGPDHSALLARTQGGAA